MSNNLDAFSFRDLVYRFLVVRNPDAGNRKAIEFMGYHIRQDDNAFLVYGYIDVEAGVTFEFLCAACIYEDGAVALEPPEKTKSFKIRYSSLQGEIVPFPDENLLPPFFLERAESIRKVYKAWDDVAEMRSFVELDPLRAPGFPDDILVLFVQEGYPREGIWCRTMAVGIREEGTVRTIRGLMLNEPDAPFGKHAGDIVDIGFLNTEDRGVMAFALL